jgi:hypothetical protein
MKSLLWSESLLFLFSAEVHVYLVLASSADVYDFYVHDKSEDANFYDSFYASMYSSV